MTYRHWKTFSGQADFEASDVENRLVEVAFFDAGHLVEHLGFRMDGWEKEGFLIWFYHGFLTSLAPSEPPQKRVQQKGVAKK